LPPPPPTPEVQQQRAQIAVLEQRFQEHPVSQWSNRSEIFRKADKIEQLQRQIAFQQKVIGDRQAQHWQEFLNLVAVLQRFGCLEQTSDLQLVPTARGKVTAGLRGDNELWLSLAFLSGELDQLAPHHLAGVCAALVSEPTRPDVYCSLGMSPATESALEGLRGLHRQLLQEQRRHNIDIPINLGFEFVGLVEQWALGMEWRDLVRQTSLDEGDIVRLCRRVLDLLSQVPYIAEINPEIQQTARQAAQMIDRFPVKDLVD
jgi:Superfamily II RNA helicase